MVAMFLDIIVVIAPLVNFEIRICTLMKVIIALVKSWETTPMDNPSKSLREGLGQGYRVKVTVCHQLGLSFFLNSSTYMLITFNCSKKLHHIATLPILILLHWNCPKGDT